MAIIDINIATPTLDEVTTNGGRSTTQEIQFTNTDTGILLDNGSRLRNGTIDANTGGSKGIAQICGVGYELKWEAGSQYVMDGNGTLIREVNHKFNIIPDANNDSTEGFYVGSRWVLDNGDVYVCTDSTATSAVWQIVVNADWNATTGSTVIANKPSIPSAQVNSDWNATSGVSEILNKPTIPTILPVTQMAIKQNASISHTGTTANTIVANYLIPAGTFQANDFFRFVASMTTTNNTNVKTIRLYFNTSISLTGATLVATRLLTSLIGTTLARTLCFKNSLSSQEIFSPTVNFGDDENVSTNLNTLSINFGVNQYLIVAIELANSADTVVYSSLRTNIFR